MKKAEYEAWIDLKKLRTKNGWRQWETAEKLGVTRAYISAVETGRRGISLRLMAAIIKIFDVKYEDFYQSKGKIQNTKKTSKQPCSLL